MVRLCGIHHQAISSLKTIGQCPYAKAIARIFFTSDFMQRFHQTLPFWVRAVLLVGVLCLIAGIGLVAYRYYEQPKTLTVAVGSFDGEARQEAQLIAGHFANTNAPIRLRIENAGDVLDAA